ncbi:AMP-binding protein [Nitrosococcus wardiae]|uniref:Acyl-[ACP]--phospholipid O-acyltransferase n=1 Tax=Nitrosococcus wardiae TaxID=1814290 RepID=A0A4P7BZ99_9GAMM|nr:AMP-binding protein [Nitrosococcus wardiae]QBQ54599.1 acyl-[ACP]--phospholipid O-acyltransferase [Nitrosococcus wardiae]
MEPQTTRPAKENSQRIQPLATLLRYSLKNFYRIRVKGLEHYQKAGQRVLLIANHISFLDPLLLATFLPQDTVFAIPPQLAQNRWLRPWLKLIPTFPLDLMDPSAPQVLLRRLNEHRQVVLFPEGRISATGSIMKIYQAPGWAAYKSGARVLPVRIEGAEDTPFSCMRGRRRWFPPITITLLPPQDFTLPPQLPSRERRRQAEVRLLETITEIKFSNSHYRRTVFEALLDARQKHGGSLQIAQDLDRQPIRYNRLVQRAFLLGSVLARETQPGEYVGVLLPNALSTAVLFFALHSQGRVPAMLNFTTGASGLSAAIEAGGIGTVYTSRRFIEAAELQTMAEILARKIRLIYLEDLRQHIGPWKLLQAMARSRFARAAYWRTVPQATPDDPAVVLFTSGSEGTPKGVVLSHANLLANIQQVASRIDFTREDLILNTLPVFHAFGLTAGTLLPLLSGVPLFLYPSPLHYRMVPEVSYHVNATILFGTNTFLAGYAQHAHPYDFHSIRYVFAGAEKLQEPTRRLWSEKFGIRIFEGYGVTEASPVLAVNTPIAHRSGTVGRLVPGIEYHLEPVEGINEGGRLEVRGPNIMLGYLLHHAPGLLHPPHTPRGRGWYDTGDIVNIDEDGYLTIRGRAKRFAKIAGEMVSLTTAEALASSVWPEVRHAVVSLPDAKKGEELVLLTEQRDAERRPLSAQAKAEGLSELSVPRRILVVEEVPLLASGKIDYATSQRWAEKKLLQIEKALA